MVPVMPPGTLVMFGANGAAHAAHGVLDGYDGARGPHVRLTLCGERLCSEVRTSIVRSVVLPSCAVWSP